MKAFVVAFSLLFLAGIFAPLSLRGDEFKVREAKIAQYKQWLDTLGPQGSQYWTRLDSGRRFLSRRLSKPRAVHRYVFELSSGAPGKIHADRSL